MADASLKKNSLQSIVDNIQSQSTSASGVAEGYVPNPNLKSLRTFQGDMQEHIETKKETVATVVLAEQKKKIERNEPLYTEKPASNIGVRIGVLAGIFLLVCGGAILGALFFINSQKQSPIDSAVAIEETLISYTQKKIVALPSVDMRSLEATLLQEKNLLSTALNTVTYTKLTLGTSTLDTPLFMSILAPNASDALKRNIRAYMTGIISSETPETFIVLQPDDFGIVYAGMLEWESMLATDLAPLFPGVADFLTNNLSLFVDETYRNKDVRTLRDLNGNVLLLYGFADKDTLIITRNEKIFETLLIRYQNSQLAR